MKIAPLVRGNIEKRYNISTNKEVYVDNNLKPFVKERDTFQKIGEETMAVRS